MNEYESIKILNTSEEVDDFIRYLDENHLVVEAPAIIISTPELSDREYMAFMRRGTVRIYHGIKQEKINQVFARLEKELGDIMEGEE